MVRRLSQGVVCLSLLLGLACGKTSRQTPSNPAGGRGGAASVDTAGRGASPPGDTGGDVSVGGAATETPDCAAELTSGEAHHCARYRDGSVWCWGEGSEGRLGDGMSRSASNPVPTGLTDVTRLASGPEHTCAVDGTNRIRCWGRNVEGQVGGNNAFEPTPRLSGVAPGAPPFRLGLGRAQSCVLDGLSHVTCWGTDEAGVRSEGQALNALEQIWAGVISTHRSPLLLTFAGLVVRVETWAKPTPTSYYGLDNLWVATSGTHGCALKRSGTLWCSDFGPDEITLRARAALGSSVLQVGAGNNFRCALTETGKVYCDGTNDSGQLGNGQLDATTSSPVAGLEDAVEVSVGASSACARRRDGSVWCWGAYHPGHVAFQPELVSSCSSPEGLPGPPARSTPSPAAAMAEAAQARGQAICACVTDPLVFDSCSKEEALVPSAACLMALSPHDTARWDCLATFLRAETACYDEHRVCPDNLVSPECLPMGCFESGNQPVEAYCRRNWPCGESSGGPAGRWLICDGVVDCPNGADELNCTPSQAAFTCVDGSTIPISSIGTGACPDNSDMASF
jgi:hypothetical protein